MSWGLVAVAGATVVGGVIGSQGAKSAAGTQADASAYAADVQREMFNKSLELQEPYREAGYGALEGLQGLSTPEGRASALSGYYQSPEFAMLNKQQEQQALRNASVTGLRGGNTQAALGEIAPQLGMNYLANQQNQLTGLANLGMGAASQGSQGAMQLGSQLGANQIAAGQASAQSQLAQSQMWGNVAGTLGGLGYNYFNPTV